jgi:RNA polymerase sigma-70 factor (ECF subfamily)
MGSEKRVWPQSPGEERKLVDRMRAGEESAFETFAECYIPALYRFARRRLDHDRELTQEVVQSTVCKVIEKLDGYRAEAPLFTWLCACCRNEIAAHYRRLERRPREVELDEGSVETNPAGGFLPVSAAAGPEERLIRAERAELVHVALDRLPPGYARAVEWRYLEGLEVTEIAHRLESSYKATESLLSRARKAFRQAYENLTENQVAAKVAGTSAEEGVAP